MGGNLGPGSWSDAPVRAKCLVSLLAAAGVVVGGPSSTAAQDAIGGPDALRETAHRVDVRLEGDVAELEHTIELGLDGPLRAEVRYRLPMPHGARLVSLEVCGAAGACRRARARRETGSWVDPYAVALHGAPRGATARAIARVVVHADHLDIVAAPVGGGAALSIRARLAAPLSIRGGRARLELPARGEDPRLAPADVVVTARGYDALAIGEGGAQHTVAASEPATVSARVSAPVASIVRTPCAGVSCVHALAIEPRRVVAHDVVLVLDVSPSMEDVPAGRVEAALRAALASLPAGSRVRALRFGARARWIDASAADPLADETPSAAPPPWGAPDAEQCGELASATPGALGSRTDFASALPLALSALDDATAAPLVIVIGDGWLDRADFLPIEARGARVVIANVGDQALARGAARAVQAAASTMALWLGPTLRGRDGPALESIVAEPGARIELRLRGDSVAAPGLVPSGEPFAWRGEAYGGTILALGTRVRARTASAAIAALLDPTPDRERIAIDARIWGDLAKWERPSRGLPRAPGGIGGVDEPITPPLYGPRRAARIPRIRVAEAVVLSTASRATFRRMIRRQLGPRVSGCFARARAGRPDWHARATLHLVLAHREVLDARVDGENVDPALQQCVLDGIDALQIPPTSSTVVLHYPFRSDARPRPGADPLDPATAALLDAIEPAAPTP